MENLKVIVLNEELADNEEFRDIEGYEGEYQVSNQGRVYSIKSGKFLKPNKVGYGYLQVFLSKNGKRKFCLVHRLVAQAFISNPLHLPIINHRDENPLNNCVENLEWCDSKYNNTYGTKIQRMMQNPNRSAWKEKTVLQFTKDEELIAEYPSLSEASRQTNINLGNISQCCRGKLNSAGKFVWRYKEEVA